jgi:hypothetical protein
VELDIGLLKKDKQFESQIQKLNTIMTTVKKRLTSEKDFLFYAKNKEYLHQALFEPFFASRTIKLALRMYSLDHSYDLCNFANIQFLILKRQFMTRSSIWENISIEKVFDIPYLCS